MFRHSLFGFASLLTLGALSLTAATPVHPKAPAAARPAVGAALTMPDGSPIAIKAHGGVILPTVEVQVVFLGDWTSSDNQTLRGNLNSAADAIVTGPYLDALTPFYGVRHGTHDSTVDLPQTFVNGTMQDADLQKLIAGWVGGRLKPLDANRLYLFYIPPGVTVKPLAASPDYGYHGSFFNGSQSIPYAVVNTSGGLPGATSVTSHEIAEAATNPTGQGYYEDGFVTPPPPPNPPTSYQPEIGDFTDGPVFNGKQYPYTGANLNGVNVQLLIDTSGNVISVPGATPDHRTKFKPLRSGAGFVKPARR